MNEVRQLDLEEVNFDQESFNKITNELRKIITQAESSGIAAWRAGEMFSGIKIKQSYHPKYTSFDSYTKEAFNITAQTVNHYITIYEKFEKNEIKDLLISNLKVISEINNINLRKKVVLAFVENKSEDIKVQDVITTVALLGNNEENISVEEINKTIKEVVTKRKKEKKKRTNLAKYGAEIQSNFLESLTDLIKTEPINEMRVVALFCIIFEKMRNKPFELGTCTLEFKSIKYIQTAFPDVCIVCELKGKKTSNTDLQVEFEYQSFNYIYHQHHKMKGKCDLIICWEDNSRNDESRLKSEVVHLMPPILELKDFLNTGKINLKI